MTPKMPRGAIPTPRSELAASEPYRPETGAEIFVPSGEFPTPNQELAAAQPYRASGAAPESFIAWPIGIGFWGNEKVSNSSWAEEAFAKACAEPKVFIPTDVVLFTSRKCGSSNFAAFMQTHGFQMDRKAYLDGPFNSVDWTNAAALNGAIANVGPVKIGVASANLASGPQGQVTPGTSGWAIYGLPNGQPENHCASLCGYGPLAAVGRSLRAARGQCQFAVGHAYGTLLRDVHLGLHRYRRPAIADEHHGRSVGSKSDDDRQESKRITVEHGGPITCTEARSDDVLARLVVNCVRMAIYL